MLQHKPIQRKAIAWITRLKWLAMAILILQVQFSYCQNLNSVSFKPYQPGDHIVDFPLKSILNFTTDSASISSFGEKLIILDFWNIHCSSCIEKFPLEDSLQRKYKDKIQFVLVAWESKSDIQEFIQKWEMDHHMKLSIPLVTDDRILHKLFPSYANPYYIWIGPSGRILSTSMGDVVNENYIKAVLQSFKERKEKYKSLNIPFKFMPIQKPNAVQTEFIKFFQR